MALTASDLRKNLGNRWWRLNNLYQILDKAGRPVQFRPNKAQAGYLRSRHYLNVILKARQMGFSTGIQIDMLDRALFNSHWKTGVIAQDLATAGDIFDDKMKFAFENLPAPLLRKFATKQDNARKLEFPNGSSVVVGTSLRGGTLQQLHVSELGKIAARYPQKAREIRTGAFNTIAPGNLIDVESTAEGNEGEFYDRVMLAIEQTEHAKAKGRPLMELEWKFHFFPWYEDTTYMVDPSEVVIPSRLVEYFNKLQKEHGIKLWPGQKAWYALKEAEQGREDMLREYPSHWKEAFQLAIEGAFYATQIRHLRQQGRITSVPWTPELPVHTAWDLGMNDMTVIWFFQVAGREVRFIDYYEANDATIAHYANVLQEKGYRYGRHFGPHDLEVREQFSAAPGEEPKTRRDIARLYHGIDFETVPRVEQMADGREAVRRFLPVCLFDEEKCGQGIKCVENYKREWDAARGVYKNYPLHDWSSHGAKAFETAARAPIFEQVIQSARPVRNGSGMGAWT